MNTFISKKDLQTYSHDEINTLIKYFNLDNTLPKNDLLWLLAIRIQYKMAYMTSVYIDCNYIDWFVDLLGTTDMLEAILFNETGKEYVVIDISEKGTNMIIRDCISRKVIKCGIKDGLYFKTAHWYAIINGKSIDSYSLNYQIRGTAHFCQTFALLILLGKTHNLKSGDYVNNIKVAINFWTNYFQDNPDMANYFLNEIKTSVYTKENRYLHLNDSSMPFNKITKKDLFEYMNIVKVNAKKFVNCRQG